MNEKEFIELVIGLKLDVVLKNNSENDRYTGPFFVKYKVAKDYEKRKNGKNKEKLELLKRTDDLNHLYLKKEWCIGGMSGGGYQSEATEFRSGEDEPDFNDLDLILNEVFPNITYLNYKILLNKLRIEYGEYTQNEYYGNSSVYKYEYFSLGNLYSILKEMKFI